MDSDRRKANLRARNLVTLFSLASLALLDLAAPVFSGRSLIEDIFVLMVILSLWRILFYSWRDLRRSSDRNHLEALPWWQYLHVAITGFAVFFLSLWMARWLGGKGIGLIDEQPLRNRTFLHAGMLLSLFGVSMGSRRIRDWWSLFEFTPIRVAFFVYSMILILGTLLLILPFSLRPEASILLLDALFVSVSALSVTGLSSVPFVNTFSLPGQAIVLVLIQIGGLGIVTLSVGLAAITRNRLSLSQSMMGQDLYDVPNIGEISPFLIRVLITTLLAELVGALWIYTALPADLSHRAFHALFHAVSAFCNAGFSTFPQNLNVPGLVGMKLGIAALIILGGMGFPIIFEIYELLKSRRGLRFLSSHSVLTLGIGGGLLVVGALGIFLTETLNPKVALGGWHRFGEAMFYSISSRTAGFNLIPVESLGSASQLIIAFLMVIGGAPISTAGGIKTTTAGVMVAAAYSVLRGHKWIQFRKGEIPPLILQKCLAVAFLYAGVVFASTLALLALERGNPMALFFEVISATSTVGLSMGITEQLSGLSKLLMIGLMISGRLGLVVMVYIGVGRVVTQRFRYPVERFYVG